MKLLLPGNYKKDLATFNSLYSECKELLTDLKEVLWIDSEQNKETSETELINGIKHTYCSSSEQPPIDKNEECICFTSHLNNNIIAILKNNSVLNCYYFNLTERKYTKVNNVNLFCEIYCTLSKYFREQHIVPNKVENLYKSKKNIERIFFNTIKKITKRYRYYNLYYEDDFFLNTFLSYYENKTKILIRKVSAEYLLRSNKKETLKMRAIVIFINDFYKLAKGDQDYVFGKVEKLFQPTSQFIFFDCGTASHYEHLKGIKKTVIVLPGSEKLFSDFSKSCIFVFLLEVVKKELGIDLMIDRSELDIIDGILDKLKFKSYNIPVIFKALNSMIPVGDYRVEIFEYSFWYQLFLNIQSVDYERVFQSEEPEKKVDETNESVEFKSIEQVKIVKEVNSFERNSPNRIERRGKVTKIFFNNVDIDFVGSRLVGWKYLEFLIINSYNGIKYAPLQLFNFINEKKKKNIEDTLVSSREKSDFIHDDEKTVQLIDQKALNEYIKKLKTFENLEKSNEIDDEELKRIKKEKHELQQFVNNNSRQIPDEKGRLKRVPKKTESPASVKKRTIKQNLEKIIDPLKDHFPEAYEHFSLYLKKESYFQYNPPKEFKWKY